MKPNIGLTDEQRAEVAKILNTLLADEYVLYTKTRNFHWNVTGPHFNDLHKFFEGQYDQLAGTVDEVAERARALGGAASGSMAEFVRDTRLRENPGQHLAATEMIATLLADHEAVIRHLREDAGKAAGFNDAGTNDFLIGLMEQHEKMAWMLRAVLG